MSRRHARCHGLAATRGQRGGGRGTAHGSGACVGRDNGSGSSSSGSSSGSSGGGVGSSSTSGGNDRKAGAAAARRYAPSLPPPPTPRPPTVGTSARSATRSARPPPPLSPRPPQPPPPPAVLPGGGVRVRPTGTAGVPINKGLRAGGAQRQWPLRRGCRRRRRCRCRVMRPPPLPAPRPSVALSRLRPQAMRRGRRAALASLAGRVCTAAAARPVGEPAAGREGEPGRGPRVWGLRPVVGDAP